VVGANYSWSDGSNGQTFSPVLTGSYWVEVNLNGCLASDTTNVLFNPLPNVGAISTSIEICVGDPITLNGTGAEYYIWDNQVLDGIEFFPLVTQTYSVVGVSTSDCEGESTITVVVHEIPLFSLGQDLTICTEPIDLTPDQPFLGYIWNDGSTDLVLTISEAGFYSLQVEDVNGCVGTDEIEVVLDCPVNIWVPNAFTPNNDGENDSFFAIADQPENLESFKMIVFNRWGNVVFESDDLFTVWKGYDISGTEHPIGVYVYQIEWKFLLGSIWQEEKFSGHFTLIR